MNTAAATSASTARLPGLLAYWRGLAPRERGLALAAALVVGAALLWLVALQPAIRVLRTAPAQLAALDAQLQQMQALATEAAELRAAPTLSAAQAAAALRSASERLGAKARLALQGERAVLTLSGASPTQLRDWLTQARVGAHARVVEAQLTRSAQGWSGTIVVQTGANR